MLTFFDLLRISRPRFWLYTAWPFLVWAAAAGFFSLDYRWYGVWFDEIAFLLLFLLLFFYFLFPANLLVYGVNDLADEHTDRLNAKKNEYEMRFDSQHKKKLIRALMVWNISIWMLLFVVSFSLFVYHARQWVVSMFNRWELPLWFLFFLGSFFVFPLTVLFLFFFFSVFYSLPPIRAKAVPFLDGVFNILYILPGLFVYTTLAWIEQVNRAYVIAGWLRCIAMHAYSAIPDIEPDRSADITTTAVYLWKKGTLLYCALLRFLAAFLVERPLGPLSPICWSIYIVLVILSWYTDVFRIYTIFPRVNGIVWFLLFWYIVLS